MSNLSETVTIPKAALDELIHLRDEFDTVIESLELQSDPEVMKRHLSYKQKIATLKDSIDDPLFQEDLSSIKKDFQTTDLEGWPQE